jgi:hypothetical protein
MDLLEQVEALEKKYSSIHEEQWNDWNDFVDELRKVGLSPDDVKITNKDTLQSQMGNMNGIQFAQHLIQRHKKFHGEAVQGEHPPLVEQGDEEETELENDYKNHLTTETLERFVDGLLTVLGELELEGQVPEIETPQHAKDALLAVVRQLYIKKSTVAKMSRKFARFGAKRFLRKQKTAIGKAVGSQ